MGGVFRSKEMADKYQAHQDSGVMEQSCVLCDAEPIETFSYWKIINNNFPYDLIAKTHHMLVPLRHIKETELSSDEWAEYQNIKAEKLQEYEYIIEATNNNKSIPAHFHLHLINAGRRDLF